MCQTEHFVLLDSDTFDYSVMGFEYQVFVIFDVIIYDVIYHVYQVSELMMTSVCRLTDACMTSST